jgi:hypothetical protein
MSRFSEQRAFGAEPFFRRQRAQGSAASRASPRCLPRASTKRARVRTLLIERNLGSALGHAFRSYAGGLTPRPLPSRFRGHGSAGRRRAWGPDREPRAPAEAPPRSPVAPRPRRPRRRRRLGVGPHARLPRARLALDALAPVAPQERAVRARATPRPPLAAPSQNVGHPVPGGLERIVPAAGARARRARRRKWPSSAPPPESGCTCSAKRKALGPKARTATGRGRLSAPQPAAVLGRSW